MKLVAHVFRRGAVYTYRLTDELATHCNRLLFKKGFGAMFDSGSDTANTRHD